MQNSSERRIGVIAIHGVGDSKPGDIVRGAGDLLASLRDAGGARYCTFGQSKIRVGVSGVTVSGRNKPDRAKDALSWGPFDEHFQNKTPVRPSEENAADSVDHLFMEGQLSGFAADGPDAVYEALRLEGYRYAPGQAQRSGTSDRRVHLYDMTWSDLSGVGVKGFRILGELYQILFHLGSIGVNNVRAAALSLPETKGWRAFARLQQFAAGCLAWPIPLLNLILLALGSTLFALGALRGLSFRREILTTVILTGVTLLAGTGIGLSRAAKVRWRTYALSITAILALFVVAMAFTWKLSPENRLREIAEMADAALILSILGLALSAVAKGYDKRRPSTIRVFRKISGAWLVLTLASIAFTPTPAYYRAMYFVLRGLDVALLLLGLATAAFWLGMFGSLIAGAWAVFKTNEKEKCRASRTSWTARLTLALPGSLFLLLTFAGWAGILRLGVPLLPATPADCPLPQAACAVGDGLCYTPLTMLGHAPLTIGSVLDYGFLISGIIWLLAILIALLIAALFSLWAFFPSVLEEVSPTTGLAAKLKTRSTANRDWLSDGFRIMRWGGEFLYTSVFLFFPVVAAIFTFACFNPFDSIRHIADFSVKISSVLGLIVAGATAGLLGFSGRLSKLALGLRPIVSVALDVDNWLRENPRGTNPTARISARFVSLLRYVLQWRDEHGRGYDSLIVLAYSQGTVIATDVLRFLHVEAKECGGYGKYDPSLARMDGIERHLFTMGCPLKQLYGWRFPYLYGYAGDKQEGTGPRASSMGLVDWANAYRSSDYVGRHLWSSAGWEPTAPQDVAGCWSPAQGIPIPTHNAPQEREYPIGVGAHTHYFDSTSEPIALILDDLIARS